jgi:hypothetical protein
MLSYWWVALLSFLIVVIIGSILHFVYEWSHERRGVAWLAATNESVWEHMKLTIWPYTIATGVIYAVSRKNRNNESTDVWLTRFIGLVLTLLIIPAVFYAYTGGGKEGRSVLAVDILTFVFAVLSGHLLTCIIPLREKIWTLVLGVTLTVILLALFTVFSYQPPNRKGLFFPYE